MEEVVLHIGTHKTGSTSIQETLAGYDDGETIYSSLSKSHLRPLNLIFSDEYLKAGFRKRIGLSRDDTEKRRTRYIDILEHECSRNDRKRMIVSSEGIWNSSDKKKGKILKYFLGKGLRVRAVCYVRDTLDFASSWIQQRIRRGEKYTRLIVTDFRGNLEPFRQALGDGDFIVRHFSEKQLFQNCVVADFCHTIGIQPKRVITRNKSISSSATKLTYQFNKFGPISSGDSMLLAARGKMILKLAESYPGGKFDERYFVDLTPTLFDDYDYVQEHYGIQFSNRNHDASTERSIDELLLDLSDVEMTPLDELISAANFDPEFFVTPIEKLTALYYHYLLKEKKGMLRLGSLFNLMKNTTNSWRK